MVRPGPQAFFCLIGALPLVVGRGDAGRPVAVRAAEPDEDAALERELVGPPDDGGPGDPQRRTQAYRLVASIARQELQRGSQRRLLTGEDRVWRNLGPTDTHALDDTGALVARPLGGRINALRTDPRDPSVVLVATSGGGVWRAQLDPAGTRWRPLFDGTAALATGSLDLDPSAPDTIYAGLGDPFVQPLGGLVKSTDGGQTWSAIVPLDGSSTATAGATIAAGRVQDVRVDPIDPRTVWVASDVGLFVSHDAGASLQLVDLPNGADLLTERVWSIAWLGHGAAGSVWLLSGTTACAPGALPPHPAHDALPSSDCPRGNLGDLWYYDGAGFTSLRAAGRIAFRTDTSGARIELGRIDLAAAPGSSPDQARVFAMANYADAANAYTADILRSVRQSDGSMAFQSARGTITDPLDYCRSFNLGGGQGWFNQAIAVDAANPRHVIVGGITCALETVEADAATPAWSLLAGPNTVPGTPYIHADWHALALQTIAGRPRALVGNDGGLFVTDLAGARSATGLLSWTNANRALSAELAYSIAVAPGGGLLAGLQDNGTVLGDPAQPGGFNHVGGGDGTGVAVGRDAAGRAILWEAITTGTHPPPRQYCLAEASDCLAPTSWHESNPMLPAGDGEPFHIGFEALASDQAATVLTHSIANLWTVSRSLVWTRVSGTHCPQAGTCGSGLGDFAAEKILDVATAPDRPDVFGAILGTGYTAVTSDGGRTYTVAAQKVGIGAAMNQHLLNASTIAFPPSGGPGAPADTYVAGSSSLVLANGAPVPPTATDSRHIGHLFITHDRGATWQALGAEGGADDLPNLPVWEARFDPADASGQTLYVATELGLYQTVDGGQHFSRVGQGLPMVRTTGIALADGGTVRVSTFGRGLWELGPPGSGTGGAGGAGGTGQGGAGGTGQGGAGGGGGCAASTGGPAPSARGALLALLMALGARTARARGSRLGTRRRG
jgi:hypothetical protein